MSEQRRARSEKKAARTPWRSPLSGHPVALRTVKAASVAAPAPFALRPSPFSLRSTLHALRFTLLALLLLLAGCATPPSVQPALITGQLGDARQSLSAALPKDRSDRRYLLDRMRLGILTLADGYPAAAQPVFEEVYDVLRTQGINADRTVASVVINEDLKIWKGEPFEQALALLYYSLQQAEQGSWDNARAAAGNSLFRLKDFGHKSNGESLDTLAIAQRAAAADQSKGGDAGNQYLNSGYAVRDSNFTLGYLMSGLANQQLGRAQEASDNYTVATQIDPQLGPLTQALRGGKFNTVLVVSFGLGPQKVAYGPDGALARFQPLFPSDSGRLVVDVNQTGSVTYPIVTDLNRMAADHMWNNLEDVREAKSILGNVLLGGGAIAAIAGANGRSREAVYAGLGAMALGVFAKAGAHADTRYCEAMPQRLYLVPLLLTQPGTRISVQVEGRPGSRLVLTGLAPPVPIAGRPESAVQLRYVSLIAGAPATSLSPPPGWAVSGQVYYSSDLTGPLANPAAEYPYILGGRSVASPTAATLQDYQRRGLLLGLTPNDLAQLYRDEGIAFPGDVPSGFAGQHVLEGGQSLIAPLGGTTGFARLFGQLHPPYQPRSPQVREAAQRLHAAPVASGG